MISLLFVFAVAAQAQKDVTKFLGIPVDGTKTAMINKLKAKGFTLQKGSTDELQGEFNGRDVLIFVQTNNNKVWRIALVDKNSTNETNIKIAFNNLCRQFEKNSKYGSLSEDQTIPGDEDISYNMSVKNKRYEAIFYQNTEMDSAAMAEYVQAATIERFGDKLDNPTDELRKEIFEFAINLIFDLKEKKTVWFMIGEEYGKYKIAMFYENKYNQSDGDDL